MSGRKTNEKKEATRNKFSSQLFLPQPAVDYIIFFSSKINSTFINKCQEEKQMKKKEATRNKFSSQLFLPQPTIGYIIFFSSKINSTFIKLFQNLLDWASHMIPNIHWSWIHRYCRLGQEVACWLQCWKNSAGFVWPI